MWLKFVALETCESPDLLGLSLLEQYSSSLRYQVICSESGAIDRLKYFGPPGFSAFTVGGMGVVQVSIPTS